MLRRFVSSIVVVLVLSAMAIRAGADAFSNHLDSLRSAIDSELATIGPEPTGEAAVRAAVLAKARKQFDREAENLADDAKMLGKVAKYVERLPMDSSARGQLAPAYSALRNAVVAERDRLQSRRAGVVYSETLAAVDAALQASQGFLDESADAPLHKDKAALLKQAAKRVAKGHAAIRCKHRGAVQASVDGTALRVPYASAEMHTTDGTTPITLWITGYDYDRGTYPTIVDIAIRPGAFAVGTHTANAGDLDPLFGFSYTTLTANEYATSGTLTVTEVDIAAKYIAGTFTMQITKEGAPDQVVEGRFSVCRWRTTTQE